MRTPHLLLPLALLSGCVLPPETPPAEPSLAVSVEERPLEPFYQGQLDARVVDYHHALRIASLKLRGNVPTLAEIRALSSALNPATTYANIVRNILNGRTMDGTPESPSKVAPRVRDFWRNTLRLGAPANPSIGAADPDAAAVLATMITLSDDKPYAQLFTTPSDDCFTLAANGTFSSSKCNCTGGACFGANPPQAGLVANPAFMAANVSAMSFHRVRMVQEIFVCKPTPAELADAWDTALPPPAGTQTLQSTPINFNSTDGVVCAKCHQTINRQAPLFAVFDDKGVMRNTGGGCPNFPTNCDFQSITPITPPRAARLSDYLMPLAGNATPVFGWRADHQGPDLTALGAAMAQDPDVARCLVNRLWYWLMSRRDIVSDPVRPPTTMTDAWIAVLNSPTNPVDGSAHVPGTLKAVLLSMLTSDDFVRF